MTTHNGTTMTKLSGAQQRVRVSGPLEVFAVGFAAELARLGYRRTPMVASQGPGKRGGRSFRGV